MQQIKLLCNQVVIFNMVHKLALCLFESNRVLPHLLNRGTKRGTLIAAYVVLFDLIAESVVVDSVTAWLPLEIKKRVNWLYFYPPGASQHRFTNESRIVTMSHDELVAVFNVSVLKWYLRDLLLILAHFSLTQLDWQFLRLLERLFDIAGDSKLLMGNVLNIGALSLENLSLGLRTL